MNKMAQIQDLFCDKICDICGLNPGVNQNKNNTKQAGKYTEYPVYAFGFNFFYKKK